MKPTLGIAPELKRCRSSFAPCPANKTDTICVVTTPVTSDAIMN